ncbi:putative helicase mov-10-B.2 [Centropristis striata]|uniref:putative helicase mov-10-B.2 n=1 Tax=Centropristis striata TaxID=184440 RepID=UPI0027E14B86|nr:putative helicase mov-10-B.2 [Centropristis striata]
MSSLNHQQRQTQMWPLVWSDRITKPGKSGSCNGPQNTPDTEALMARHARRKIRVCLKMAKLFQQYRAQLHSNKHGVSVSSDPPSTDEKICLTLYENRKVVLFTVKNSGIKEVSLSLWASDLVKNIFTVKDSHGNKIKTMKQLRLRPGEHYKIKVHFYSQHDGFYEQLLVFQFETHQHRFEIMRLFEVTHRTSFSEEPVPAATNNLDLLNVTWNQSVSTLRRPVVELKKYPLPNDIKDLKKYVKELKKETLNWKNYNKRFELLLHLEELQEKTEIEIFNQEGVLFKHQSIPDIVTLKIADASPNSLLRLSKEKVLATRVDRASFFLNTFYKGWVRHVDAERIYLQFDDQLERWFKDGMRFRIYFVLNRISLRVQHRAVELACKRELEEVLFPTGQFSFHHSELQRMTKHEINPEQCKAVQHIVAASAKPAPYLVFGPPGTGKTVTLVEAINQIMKTHPESHILACAPSNNATDHLCEKILERKLGKKIVYRLYALSYPVKNIPKNIRHCCNLNFAEKGLLIPSKKQLMRYKILLTTLQTSARLLSGGIPPGHYTYIFVDEAGQSTETECIIPIAGLMNQQKCQVVLAGDPKQLGPIITSRVAEKHGLNVSLLERLMDNVKLYRPHETDGFNNRFVTKLLRNYRSHPAILKIPNELFYDGELQPFADKVTCSSYCKWERLPKKGFPLIFHGVAGINELEANSTSYYNMAELEVLKEYLKAILCHLHKVGVKKIGPGEIGIISPYRKQVEKIQKALQTDKDLKEQNLENILVGSVEQFQGKEFNAILVSTVRSGPKMTANKPLFTLGFIDNEKRFNVAVTRARSLLIVVGDPRALQTDHNWNKFIHYCFKEGGYCGIAVSDQEEEREEEEEEAMSLWCNRGE